MGKRRHNAKGRTTGEPRFVQIPFWVLESSAAIALSGTAFKVLVYIIKRYNGVNNGKIGFGQYSGCFIRNNDAKDPKKIVDVGIGFASRTMSDALYELEKAGFIACTRTSTFDQKRLTREWRITWLPADNALPTKEFTTATGNFKRPKAPKKQKPERGRALSGKLQSAYAPQVEPESPPNDAYRAATRSMAKSHRAPTRPHLVTIPSGSDPQPVVTAATSDGATVSLDVLNSAVSRAARALEERRASAAAPAVDTDAQPSSSKPAHRIDRVERAQ